MVEKEVTLKILADVDDSQVEDLENVLQQIVDGKITIPVETESSELEEVESRIEELEQKRADIYMGVDDSDLTEVESELEELEQRQIDLTVNVDDSGLDGLSSKMDEVESKSSETSDAISAIGGAAAGLSAAAGFDQMITTADNINQSWDRLSLTLGRYGVSVDDIKAKQNELTAATGRTGGEFRNFANTMSLAGIHDLNVIGDAFEAASAGAMKTNSSVEQVANSFQRMAMQGTLSTRVLKNSGVELEDLARVLGVSVDQVSEKFKSLTPEERLKALSSAMVNAKDANDMYKNSLQSVKAQADAAFAGLMGAIGQTILPIVIPAMQTLTSIINGLSNGFKQLPAPLQSIIGGFGALVLGATALFGALSVVGFALKGVSDGFKTLKSGYDLVKSANIVSHLRDLASAARGAISSIITLGKETLIAGANALKAAGMWVVEKVQILASAVAKYAGAAASMVLAAAEWLAASPILLVVAAVLLLIGVLWYLYNTNEDVRNAIDGFAQALWNLGGTITGALAGAFAWLQGAWQNTVDFFTNGGTALSDAITGTFTWIYESIVAIFTGIFEWLTGIWQGIVDFFTGGGQTLWDTLTGVFMGVYDIIVGTLGGAFQWLTDTWNSVVNAFMTYAPLIAQVLFIMATGGIGAIVLLIANMNGMPNQIGAILQSIISRVVSWVGNLVSQFASGAQRAVSNFLSPLKGLVDSVSAELSAVYSAVMSFIQPLIDAFNALGSAASWAFSFLGLGQRSPGNIYKSMKQELEWTTSFVEDDKPGLVSATANLGRDLVSSFNPRIGEGLSFNVDRFAGNRPGTPNEVHGNGQQPVNNLTFNLYGDMDTEERMKRFLDYVVEYMDWDNKTAGRDMEVR